VKPASVISFLTLGLCCLSCKKEKTFTPATNAISFEAPAIGQSSRYLRFIGNGAFSEETGSEYFRDTLVLEIAGKDDNGWRVREYYASGSISLTQPETPDDSLRAANVNEYYLRVDADSIYFFPLDENDLSAVQKLRLFWIKMVLPTSTGNGSFKQNGWELTPPNNDCPAAGKVKNYEHLGYQFGSLHAVKNSCMSPSDGPDYIYAYSMHAGLVRQARLNIWNGKAYGWDLIPGTQ
jgi:hypothetical protein